MRKLLYISLIAALAGTFASCTDQDDIYKQWVVPGGSIYPEKANGLKSTLGAGRVQLKWAAPKDPAVKRAVITWDNGEQSRELTYADYAGQDSILVEIDDLKEQSYTFSIVNYDAEGHISMTSEQTAAPYGKIWLSTHAERTINSAQVSSGTDAVLAIGFGTNEMVATKFRYINNDGETVVTDPVPSSSQSATLPNAKVGKRYEYSSGYCPAAGLDTIWNDWSKAPTPIAGLLATDGWEATAQGSNSGYGPEKALDGHITTNFSNGWWWNNATYPKIFLIDTGKDTYYMNRIVLYQNSGTGYAYRTLNNVEMYCGNEKFDINAGSDYANTEPFKNAVYKHTTMVFWNGSASATWNLGEMKNFRYIAFVIKNSRRNGSAINEVQCFGYDSAAE